MAGNIGLGFAIPVNLARNIKDQLIANNGVNGVIAIVNDDDRNPRLKCLRGDAHNIAVELGLKRGQVFKGDAGDLRLAAVA